MTKLNPFFKNNFLIPAIILIVLIKIAAMSAFSSDYQNKLFMEFIYSYIDSLMQGNFENPYNLLDEKRTDMFPYPPGMFLIQLIGGFLSYFIHSSILQNLLFKLPNLFFDCLGLYFLLKMFPNYKKYTIILYFTSPIIFYASYMHGQLDIIPTVLLLGALYFLTATPNNKYATIISCAYIFAALSTKLHILAAIPILFLYLMKRPNGTIFNALRFTLVPIILLFLLILPFWGESILYNVIFNSEQKLLTQIGFNYERVKLYIPLFAIAIIYLKTLSLRNINSDLLFSLLGLLFAVFIGVIPPMPGWYVWFVPFMAIFFINISTDKYTNLLIYALLNIAYLIYFIFAHNTSYVDLYFLNIDLSNLKLTDSTYINIVFTVLTALLFYTVFMMYQFGLSNNNLYKRKNAPFTIGISGDSGSGKSSFLKVMERLLGKNNILYLEGDGDHRWERNNEKWDEYTHLNPKANYLYRQASDISKLKGGGSVLRVDYDHRTGKFTDAIKIFTKPYIFLSGLHSLYLPQLRSKLDIKIFMDIDETLRRYWKIQRDIKKRGYTKEQILKQIEARVEDAEKYIYPQKEYADYIITYFDENLNDCLADNHDVKLSLKILVDASIDLELFLNIIQSYGILTTHDYSFDLSKQTVVFKGDALNDCNIPFTNILNQIIRKSDNIPRCSFEDFDNITGITAVIFILLINQKIEGDNG